MLSAPLLRAQAPAEPTRPTVLPPTSVEVVRIDVVVTDKGGHPTAGLAREDFAVVEDGKPQRLVQFGAYARPMVSKSSAAARSPSVPVIVDQPVSPRPPRFVMLVVDDVHIEFANMVRTREALIRFINEDMNSEDQIALVTTRSAPRGPQEFTSNRDSLRRAISHLTPWVRPAEWLSAPHLTEYQAEMIERGDTLALELAVQELLRERPGDPAPEAQVRQAARLILAEAVYNSQLTLETVERVTRGLSRLPGRKVIFLLSDGFTTGRTAQSGAGFDIRRITDASTRADVVIYSLETRGLTTPSGWSASDRVTIDPQTLSLKFMIERQSEEAMRDAMHGLAADTGGFLANNSNDLHAGLRHMLEDTQTYYVLAYEPTNTKRDGGFRHIEVRLPKRRDLKVRARAGYFAAVDRHANSPLALPEQEEHRTQRRSSGTGGASARLTVIPVQLSADFVSVERGVTEVVVSGHADSTTLPFVRRGDRYSAVVEMTAIVYGETGAVATTLTPQRVSLDMTEGQHQLLLKEGLPYQRSAALEPGRYDVHFVVRTAAAGALGVASQSVEIPDLTPGRLTLSDLFLLKASEAADSAPLVLNQALRRYRSNESLYAQLYAYNPGRSVSGTTDLVWQAKILSGGVIVESGVAEPMVVSQPQEPPVPCTNRIRLDRLAPGEYELEVTVTDRNANEVATRRVGFTID